MTFLAQEEEHWEPGLLLAQVLHALLGQLHAGARMPEACGSDDEGGHRDREKGAGTKEKQRLGHALCLPQTVSWRPSTSTRGIAWAEVSKPEAKLAKVEERGAERSEEHTSELQSRQYLVCRLLLEKKKKHKHHQ